MKKTAFVLTLFVSALAFAVEGGEHAAHGAHGDEHIPLEQIGWQAANLGILLVALFFFIRKSVVEAFQDRRKSFIERSEKTKSALIEAEKTLSDNKAKLALLEQGEATSLQTAQKEALAMKESLIKEAEHNAEKMKKEATMLIANELMKAKAEINQAILTHAISGAAKNISEKGQSIASQQEASFLKQLEQVKA